MDVDSEPPPQQQPEQAEKKLIRITTHGKIRTWVTYSLQSLKDNPSQPLIFHTLPATTTQNQQIDKPEAQNEHANAQSGIRNITSTIPRLISVVEILKREYLKALSEQGSSRLIGLYQYNEVGSWTPPEDTAVPRDATGNPNEDEEVMRREGIRKALEGKNFPSQTQTPYLKITLSLEPLPHLLEVKGDGKTWVTHQPPSKRNISRSAKARARKREKAKGAGPAKEAETVEV